MPFTADSSRPARFPRNSAIQASPSGLNSALFGVAGCTPYGLPIFRRRTARTRPTVRPAPSDPEALFPLQPPPPPCVAVVVGGGPGPVGVSTKAVCVGVDRGNGLSVGDGDLVGSAVGTAVRGGNVAVA